MEKEESSKIIRLAHGAGGVLQEELIKFITKDIPLKNVNSGIGVEELDDGATIPLKDYDKEIVITADGHTVFPLFFPGGDLGKLSVCGTVNDILMMGAKPLALTSIIIIEEGFNFFHSLFDFFLRRAWSWIFPTRESNATSPFPLCAWTQEFNSCINAIHAINLVTHILVTPFEKLSIIILRPT